MPDVLILLGPEAEPFSTALGVAFQQAIEQDSQLERSPIRTEILKLPELAQRIASGQMQLENHLVSPLTLEIPDWLMLPERHLYAACQDVQRLRQQAQQWGYRVGRGDLWLPIVHTARGSLYGEAIGEAELGYIQPVHLPDRQRQPLYRLGFHLMRALQAPPAVYLMQFGLEASEATPAITFDQLLPFPSAPAIASCAIQSPNLFTCHWRCLTGKPIRDLVILGEGQADP